MNIKKIIDKRLVLFIPALVMMYIIFSFSSDDAKESSILSLEVTTDIVKAVDEVVYDNSMDDTTFKDYVKKLHLPVRKGAHMTEYALLAILIFLPLLAYCIRFTFSHYLSPVVVVFLYACTDEFHQTYINGRAGQMTDVLIDTSGAVIAIILAFLNVKLISYIKRKKSKKELTN